MVSPAHPPIHLGLFSVYSANPPTSLPQACLLSFLFLAGDKKERGGGGRAGIFISPSIQTRKFPAFNPNTLRIQMGGGAYLLLAIICWPCATNFSVFL